MADEIVIGSAAVEIKATLDKLKEGLNQGKAMSKNAVSEMQRNLENIKMNMDDRLAKIKLEDVRLLHKKLKQRLEEKIHLNFDEASISRTRTQLKSVEDALDKVKQKSSLAGKSGSFFDKLGLGKAVGLIGGVFATREIFQFAEKAKDAARDAEEVESKFNTVFSSIREEANRTANEFAESFKLAGSTARELLSGTGDILVGFGFDEKTALELSREVNSLAIDLASFSNFAGGAAGASKALTSAMLGETEAAKSLGIVLRQGTPEFERQLKTTMQARGVSENQARALVLLSEAYKQSSKAVGDFSRTQNEAANQERSFAELQKEVTENIGKETLPAYQAVLKYLTALISEMNSGNNTFSVFGALTKSITTGLLAVGWAIESVIRGAYGLGQSIGALISGNFSDIPTQLSEAWDGFRKSHENTSKLIQNMWSDVATSSNDSTNQIVDNLNKVTTDSKKSAEEVAKIWKTYYETMKFEAEDYYNYKKGIIEKEVAEFLKSTGNQVKAEELKIRKLKQLGDEYFSWLKSNYGIGFSDAIKLAGSKELFGRDGKLIGAKEGPSALSEKKKGTKPTVEMEKELSLWERIALAEEDAFKNLSEFWTSQISLFSNANSMLEQFLDTLVQVALQQAAMSAIGSFSGGGILGGLASILGLAKGGSVTNSGGNVSFQPHKSFASGTPGFTVPPGFNRDNYLVGVQSGERLTVTPANQKSANSDFSSKHLQDIDRHVQVMNANLIELHHVVKSSSSISISNNIDSEGLHLAVTRGKRAYERYH